MRLPGQLTRSNAATAAGIGAIAVLAIADILVSATAVLIPLLVLGPLFAAAGASVWATAAVAGIATVIAIALGPFGEGLFAPQHLVQVAVVSTGSLFAVLAAAARVRFERSQRAAEVALAGERAARIEANLVARASELLATSPEPEERLAQVAALAVPDIADISTVDLLEADGTLRTAAVDAADPDVAEAVRAARARWPIDPEGPHPVAIAARTGAPQVIAGVDRELEGMALPPGYLEHVGRLGSATAMTVPLVARGRTLGVFAFVGLGGRAPYGANDVRLAVELARRAAAALDNARLFAELRRTEGRLETILGNLAEAVTVQAPDGGLLYANQAAAELLECSSPDEVLATPPPDLAGRFVTLDENGHPFDFVRLPGREALGGATPAPVTMRTISRRTGEERWMLVKATPVRDPEGDVSMAVNIIEDVTEARRAERHQRFLADASKLVSASLDVETTLERAAWAIVPEIADWCWVEVLDDRGTAQRRVLAAADPRRGAGLAAAHAALDPGAEHGPPATLRDGRPRLHPAVDDDLVRAWARDDAAFAALRSAGLRSVLTVPLRAGDRVIGAMTLGTDSSSRRLRETDLALAAELGVRAGIAVENARLHAARTHIATTLQRSLLPPRLPAVPGVTIAARFRAAGESSEVGGDFYDVFPVSGAWMVVMGDVTGKGPEAASITSLARYTMRTAAEYEASPAGVMQRLNATLMDPERRRLCTVVCARLTTEPDGSAVVTFACAGHPPPFLLRDGRAEPVDATGPLLGAFEAGRWRETVVRMAPGESLVLYTDGVTDTRNGAERFGSGRLSAVLEGAAGLEPDEIATRIDAALLDFERGPQRDDLALLVLRASGGAVATAPAGAVAGRPAA